MTRLLILICVAAALFVACTSDTNRNELDCGKKNSEYAPFLSLGEDCVLFSAPWIAVKNDIESTNKTELHPGDFLRIPETEEVGEILKVVDAQNDCAIIEYTYYSAPPAPEEQRSCEFEICQSD